MSDLTEPSIKSVPPARPQVITVTVIMVALHVACLAVVFTGVSTVAVLAAVAMYVIRGLGITAGFHRLLAHRSFKTNRVVQFLLALAGSLAVQGGPLWWVAHHREHHRDTDTEEDIHSPVMYGLWHSHMGWMMSDAAFNEKGTNARDLHKYPEIKWLQRYYVHILVVEIVALYLLGAGLAWWNPALGTSGPQMLVWGFAISTVFTWHVTFMVNSVCHRWGAQPYDTGDASTNNVLIGVLGFGEGWHNNHHYYPNSARHGLRWWQLDATWMLLKVLEKVGLASDLKVPKELRDKQAAKRGDRSSEEPVK